MARHENSPSLYFDRVQLVDPIEQQPPIQQIIHSPAIEAEVMHGL